MNRHSHSSGIRSDKWEPVRAIKMSSGVIRTERYRAETSPPITKSRDHTPPFYLLTIGSTSIFLTVFGLYFLQLYPSHGNTGVDGEEGMTVIYTACG